MKLIYTDHLGLNLPQIKKGEEVTVLNELDKHITYRFEVQSVKTKKTMFVSGLDLQEKENIEVQHLSEGQHFMFNNKLYFLTQNPFGVASIQEVEKDLVINSYL